MEYNYRRFYEKTCGIKIPKNYIIHHIDFDRSNNDITNLVMLPNSLHSKYHNIANKMKQINEINYDYELPSHFGISAYNRWLFYEKESVGEKFINVYSECSNYIMYRDYLLGLIPIITENVQKIIDEIGD